MARRNVIAVQRRNRDLTLNETAKLRMEQRNTDKTIEAVLEKIKETCHE